MTLREQWIEKVRNNPIMLKDIVIAGGMLGAAFGLEISTEQLALVTAFVMALWSPLTRSQVTTMRRPQTSVDGETVPLVPAVPDNPV